MRLYCVFICLFIFGSCRGQEHGISVNFKPSVSYFGKQSQGFDNYYISSRKGNETYKTAINILYTGSVSQNISITAGVEYSQQGQNIAFETNNSIYGKDAVVFNIELNYVRIPLLLNYSFIKNYKNELRIYSGVSVGMATKRKDNYQHIILESILLPPAEKRYNNNDLAIPLGIIYQKILTSNVFVNLGFEYLQGIAGAFSTSGVSKFGVLSEFDNSRQKRMSLNSGIGFRFTK